MVKKYYLIIKNKENQMDLTDLENCFAVAYAKDAKYIAVIIEMRGFERPEIIINS